MIITNYFTGNPPEIDLCHQVIKAKQRVEEAKVNLTWATIHLNASHIQRNDLAAEISFGPIPSVDRQQLQKNFNRLEDLCKKQQEIFDRAKQTLKEKEDKLSSAKECFSFPKLLNALPTIEKNQEVLDQRIREAEDRKPLKVEVEVEEELKIPITLKNLALPKIPSKSETTYFLFVKFPEKEELVSTDTFTLVQTLQDARLILDNGDNHPADQLRKTVQEQRSLLKTLKEMELQKTRAILDFSDLFFACDPSLQSTIEDTIKEFKKEIHQTSEKRTLLGGESIPQIISLRKVLCPEEEEKIKVVFEASFSKATDTTFFSIQELEKPLTVRFHLTMCLNKQTQLVTKKVTRKMISS